MKRVAMIGHGVVKKNEVGQNLLWFFDGDQRNGGLDERVFL